MNPFIAKELNKVKVARIPPFDNSTTYLKLEKISTVNTVSLVLNHYYLIELANYIIHPPENFNLHINWNNNNVPKYMYMKCQVIQLMGKMVKIDGIACDMKDLSDIDYKWQGWLPLKSISVIKELT